MLSTVSKKILYLKNLGIRAVCMSQQNVTKEPTRAHMRKYAVQTETVFTNKFGGLLQLAKFNYKQQKENAVCW